MRFITVFILLLSNALCYALPSEVEVQKWIIKADSYRSPFKSGQFTTTLTLFKKEQAVDSKSYFVQLNDNGDSRVTMLDKRSKGQKVLLTENAMWLYIPRTRKAIRITPMQRLMGQASYGDVSSLNWQYDYAWDQKEIEYQQSDKQTLRCFTMQASSKSATYRKIDLCIEKESSRPVSAQFYLASGKLMKQALYYQSDLNSNILDQTKFTQPGKEDQYTLMQSSDYVEKSHSEKLFTRQGFTKQ